MNILFLTIGGFQNPNQNGVYTDLLRYFSHQNHMVYVVCQREKRENMPTVYEKKSELHILRVKSGNITKVGWIEKGISTLAIGSQYEKAINKYFSNVIFDMVLYSTPPITLASLVGKLRKKQHVFTYLMLKDIFPQNAIDLNILSKKGVKGFIYRYFKKKEQVLYKNSDMIGCMSQANQTYLLTHNPDISPKKVEICPNTLDSVQIFETDKQKIRTRLNLPSDKVIFLYGGNFGKPQNVEYIIKALKASSNFRKFHFVLCGSGTDFGQILNYSAENPPNVTVLHSMPFEEYAKLISACDIGLLFLDYRFTIPNFPSRLLDYLNYGLPVLALTDKNTDVGKVIVNGGFGWWGESRNVEDFVKVLSQIEYEMENLPDKGKKAKQYMIDHYSTKYAYEKIINSYNSQKRGTYVSK